MDFSFPLIRRSITIAIYCSLDGSQPIWSPSICCRTSPNSEMLLANRQERLPHPGSRMDKRRAKSTAKVVSLSLLLEMRLLCTCSLHRKRQSEPSSCSKTSTTTTIQTKRESFSRCLSLSWTTASCSSAQRFHLETRACVQEEWQIHSLLSNNRGEPKRTSTHSGKIRRILLQTLSKEEGHKTRWL